VGDKMNLYKISRNNWMGFDIYTGAIVAAETAEDASKIHPNRRWGGINWIEDSLSGLDWGEWVLPEYVRTEYIGTTHLDKGVVLASFKAG